MVAGNENQTYAQFQAGEPVNPCASIAIPGYGGTLYELGVDGRQFALMRLGKTLVPGMKEPAYGWFPTAGTPHPMCPPHVYVPPEAVRCAPVMRKSRPSYLTAI